MSIEEKVGSSVWQHDAWKYAYVVLSVAIRIGAVAVALNYNPRIQQQNTTQQSTTGIYYKK
jgi:uncharacterized membrane-anchored protein YhcB (DUF1043 family)